MASKERVNKKPSESVFYEKVIPVTESGCWLWTGTINKTYEETTMAINTLESNLQDLLDELTTLRAQNAMLKNKMFIPLDDEDVEVWYSQHTWAMNKEEYMWGFRDAEIAHGIGR